MKYFYKKWGFTLVELMIVIAIIGILAAVLFPSVTGYFERARDVKKKAELHQINFAITSYYMDNGRYEIPESGCKKGFCGGFYGVGFMSTNTKNLPHYHEKSIISQLKNLWYLWNQITPVKFNYKATKISKNSPICNINVHNMDDYLYKLDDNIGKYAVYATLENPTTADLENVQKLLHWDIQLWRNINDGACTRWGKNYWIGN